MPEKSIIFITKKLKAIIIAGGKGTRLGSMTQDIPKPMVEINKKPILEYQIELLKRYGIKEIILVVNHLYTIIEDYFSNGQNHGVSIDYFVEPMPLGTVGGIKELENELSEDFLVLYGDVMMDVDFDRLIHFHKNHQGTATLVLHPNDHPYDSDLVEVDNNDKIIAFYSKPHPQNIYLPNMVNAGLYVFSPEIFSFLNKGEKADFGKDIFPKIYKQTNLYGYNTPEYLKDMGTLDRLEQVTNDVVSGKVERFNLSNQRRAIFLDRDGVINLHKDYIYTPEMLELYDFVGAALKKINQSEYLSVVVTNQPVVARNLTTEEGLKKIHHKMESLLGEQHAKFDAIYYCPHHPDIGFEGENKALKIDCDCRKPKPGMLLEAAKRFNIDLPNSYIIGDSERDIVAGISAGVHTIGVMTGCGNKDGFVRPDYLFANLLEAVNFIIEDPLQHLAQYVLEEFKKSVNRPYIIAIGGNTRGGKSTLSTYLKKFFIQNKHTATTIHLDNWIKEKEERQEQDDVYKRFNTHQMVEDLKFLFEGNEITLYPYRAHKNMERAEKEIRLNNEEVIIIEGVVALGVEYIREIADHKIFVNIEMEELKKRMYDYYLWKGYTLSEIENIFEKRKIDEYEPVALHSQYADTELEAFEV